MDTDLLKTFLEVHRCRHFGKAAEHLYLTASAVSFRIRQLENQLGTALFSRHRNNIQLTAAGEALVPHAEAILSALKKARKEVSHSAEAGGRLAISATNMVWESFLNQRIGQLAELLPNHRLQAEISTVAQMTRQLVERTLDMALATTPPKGDDIITHKLAHIELLWVCSQPGRDSTNVLTLPYIKINWGNDFDLQQAHWLKEAPMPQLQTGTPSIGLSLLLQKQGFACLPDAMVKPMLEQHTLYPVQGLGGAQRQLYLSYNRDNEHRLQLEQLIEQLG